MRAAGHLPPLWSRSALAGKILINEIAHVPNAVGTTEAESTEVSQEIIENVMKICELSTFTPEIYVLTTIGALAREPNGRHWIDPEAPCYPRDGAPPGATIKVRCTTPGDGAAIAASLHQDQAGISMVGGCPAGWVAVDPTEFD